MSTPAEEPPSQNGLQPDPATNPESQPESQPVLEPEPAPVPETQPEPVPEPEAQPEPEAKAELQPRPEPVVSDGADPTVETSTPIQSSSQGTARPELKNDEGSRTFTMRELLNGLKNEGNDAANESSSPYSYRFTSPFISFCKLCYLHYLVM